MTRAETVFSAIRQILDGHKKPDILEWIEQQRGGSGELRTPAAQIYAEAIHYFEALPDESPAASLGFCMAAMLELFRRCCAIGDYPAARQALKDYAQLTGATLQAKSRTIIAPHKESPDTGVSDEADFEAMLKVIVGGK